ncbi:MAG: 30S ribosomal protein S6 [Parcubacteria group bacterium GW2011_GWC1_38_6]|nr:MAG: 30S ribosomal protein S6 [Parcubacteria group bacterium GW2011_GWC1_38_6]
MLYELMLVTATEKGDLLVSRVEKSVKEIGNNLKVDKLGKKPLAYTIKKQTDANYYVLNFKAEGNVVKQLTDKLRLEQEDLLRYLLLKNVEKKASSKKRKVVEVEEKEQKAKPKVTVAVRKVSAVKSTGNKKGGTSSKAKSTRFASEARRARGKRK